MTPEEYVERWVFGDSATNWTLALSELRGIIAEEREACAKLIDARREEVLANAADPTWTEHFAELADAIRARK